MEKKYKNPPIEEAVVEFRFAPGEEWNLTIPGKLHEHPSIKNKYQGKPRTQKFIDAALQSGADQTSNLAVREGVGRIQLVDPEGRHVISLGMDVMSVNLLRPYNGWNDFRPQIEDALKAYFDVAKPTGVNRVGVRYINRIVIEGREVTLDTYFRYKPPSVQQFPKKMAGFFNRVEYVYEDAIKLLLTQATVDAPADCSAFLVDIDVIWEKETLKELPDIMRLVDDLHEREGEAFEAVITDAAREVFNAA